MAENGGSEGQGAPAGGAGGGGQGQGEAMVPSGRLREETAARQAAESRVRELEQQAQGWASEQDLMRAGITDPDGIELAKHFHGKLPEKDRPGMGDWVRGLKPETAPKGLAPYLPGSPAPTPKGDPAPTGRTTMGGRAPTTTTPTTTGAASGSGGYDAQSISALREEAVRTGDMSKLRDAMPQIWKSVNSGR